MFLLQLVAFFFLSLLAGFSAGYVLGACRETEVREPAEDDDDEPTLLMFPPS